jgi:hypothetical protein
VSARQRATDGAVLATIAVLVLLRFAVYEGDGTQALLMAVSVVGFVGLQALLLALRAADLTRVIYGYLATPYFGHRALAEVWLGSPQEAAAGTFAPWLLGDLVVLQVLLRSRPRVPLALLGIWAALTLPLLALFAAPGFEPGAFVYQYVAIARAIGVTWFAHRLLRQGRPIAGIDVARHLGIIFGVMGLVSGSVAFVLGTRFGWPGWGSNVYANALCVVGALCVWYALERRRPFLALLAGACLVGMVGSGTRVALVVFVVAVAGMVLVRLVPRRLRVVGGVAIALAGAVVGAGFPGQVIALAGEVNPRLRVVGGVEITRDVGLPTLLAAIRQESSVRTRLELWSASVAMFERHPLTGVGWGQWNWRKAQYGVGFDVLLDPHNGYLWLFAEGGLLAGGVLLLAAGAVLLRARRSPYLFAFALILALELTNANVQKAPFGVLTAVVVATALAQGAARQRASSIRSASVPSTTRATP